MPSRGRSAALSARLKSMFDGPSRAILAVYTVSWGLILLNGGRYWDDWTMVRMSVSGARLMGDMAGQPWQPYLWLTMSWVPGAEYIVHALTFVAFGVAALALNRVLRRVPQLGGFARTAIPALFAVFPVNAARIAHIDFPYTLSVVAFYVAWYLIAVDLERPGLGRRCAAAALLAFALLTTKSMLVLFVLIPLYVLWLRRADLFDSSARNRLLLRYGFLLPLPVVVWAADRALLAPWGLYATYNVIGTDGKPLARMFLAAVRSSLIEPIAWALPALVLALPLYFLIRRRPGWWPADATEPDSTRTSVALVLIGAFAFVLATLPYLLVGKVPQAVGADWWDSRHQVLLPLGAALLVYGAVALVARMVKGRQTLVPAVVIALLLGFAVANVRTCLLYQADWYRQVALMQHMADSADMRDGNFFIVRDDAHTLNAVDRRLMPYEFSGMMFTVFGDETRFAVDEAIAPSYGGQLPQFADYEQYHWRDFEKPERGYVVEIVPGTVDVRDPATLLSLMWQQRFDRAGFERRVHDVIELDTEPLDLPDA